MLQTNATIGSGKNGYVAGFRIGGKTGTSEKLPTITPAIRERIRISLPI